MKNFHWGKAIALFFVCYIGTLIFVVFKSRTVDHSLVTEDYYAQDIKYQSHYDQQRNRMKHYPGVSIDFDENQKSVEIDFKKEGNISGDITLYRAMEKSVDQSESFSLTEGSRLSIPVKQLREGKWSIQITWHDDTREYYYEDDVYMVQS